MSKAKLKTFSLGIKATIDFCYEIKAESLEDALAKARALKPCDLLPEVSGGYNDYNDVEITSLWAA